MLLHLFFATMIFLNGHPLEVEIAQTPEERRQGLMGRLDLPAGRGMLFIYPGEEPRVQTFWMKNTKIPLSIAFFGPDQRLIKMVDLNPPISDLYIPTCSSDQPILYALEVPQGWFAEHNIQQGDRIDFPSN